ncbi:MAG: glycosyltransferase family 2 protein [Betaproteobacteria bacterium]|uniref:Glycosyltransferase family 2 protein n=1 Tax=Candidatus Proximibacter danicus TaxID=2954365 RepID=A0A9D7PT17_9PROT|nr:glycosyltransferase family 2 protein [Candidatus Proximibacter danicus]
MTLPLVSIAIPAYRHARYIETCLASVCAQTYPELELVLIDDGSPDDTFEVAKRFLDAHRDRFRHIVLERRENRGSARTRTPASKPAAGNGFTCSVPMTVSTRKKWHASRPRSTSGTSPIWLWSIRIRTPSTRTKIRHQPAQGTACPSWAR